MVVDCCPCRRADNGMKVTQALRYRFAGTAASCVSCVLSATTARHARRARHWVKSRYGSGRQSSVPYPAETPSDRRNNARYRRFCSMTIASTSPWLECSKARERVMVLQRQFPPFFITGCANHLHVVDESPKIHLYPNTTGP